MWEMLEASTRACKEGRGQECGGSLPYSLPNLYVDGDTKHSKAFNCIQRSHQQIFETLHMYHTCSAVW